MPTQEEILQAIERQQAAARAVINQPIERGVGGALTGMGGFLAGLGEFGYALGGERLRKQMAPLAAKQDEANYQGTLLQNELTGYQADEARQKVRDAREALAVKQMDKYLMAGQNPLDYLPESAIEASGVPILPGNPVRSSTGEVLMGAGDEPIMSGRKAMTIGDVLGPQIDGTDPKFRASLTGFKKQAATPKRVEYVETQIRMADHWAASANRAGTKGQTTNNLWNTINATWAKMQNEKKALAQEMLMGPGHDDTIQDHIKTHNALFNQLKDLRKQAGKPLDDDLTIPDDFAFRPQEEQLNIFQRAAKVWQSIQSEGPPAVDPPVPDSPASTKPKKQVPGVATQATPNPNLKKKAKPPLPPRNGESDADYYARGQKAGYTDDELAAEWTKSGRT